MNELSPEVITGSLQVVRNGNLTNRFLSANAYFKSAKTMFSKADEME